ncbi:structural protein P5 [Vibrio sp. SCSIO 43137]|uniref:structural protein P5 n=1 Tax=Vibrio sp. SCSIO 43137 TaxID=3021011 RepID=UPI0023070657|nr:structural protein P5 [Vibrio sp. SCSIO 43137]WCE30099.1 structural protein P5 [Vibrio sp. SCSIO 43137]
MSKTSRGFRNKNPLNIEYNKHNKWDGQTGVEPQGRFAQFSEMKYGVRAGAKLLQTYMGKYGLRTVHGIINRWAPAHENDSHGYAEFVAKGVGVHIHDLVSVDDIPDIIYFMVKMECGSYLDMDTIEEGCQLAGVPV